MWFVKFICEVGGEIDGEVGGESCIEGEGYSEVDNTELVVKLGWNSEGGSQGGGDNGIEGGG